VIGSASRWVFWVVAGGGALAGASASAVTISEVRLDHVVFDPAKHEKAIIRFHVDTPASVEARVFDGRDLWMRTIQDSSSMAGDRSLAWDGKDEAGRLLPPEAYHFVLRATTANGEEAIYDVTDTTGGEEIQAQNVTWDASTHHVSYRLPQTARVNIRLGLQDNGPLLRTLVDWVARPGGDNEEPWDGWDSSHVLDLGHHPKLSVFVDAFALSANTLIIGPPNVAVALVDTMPWGRHMRDKSAEPLKKRMHYHSQQPIEERGDVAVHLVLPPTLPKDKDGLPEAAGRVTLRLDVDDRDRDRVIQQRFEPVFFVDGTFAFENEVGYLPFSWIWDTATVNEGIHYVTVNVRGYEGNFGMQTIKVHVRHAAADRRGAP
jgi:hypothetical protein